MKYFGVGLPRTGTKSLAAVFTMFGLRTQHIVLEGYQDYDAFCDTPIWADWRELYTNYPNAKWILTVRRVDDWILSFEKNILPHFRRWMRNGPSRAEGRWSNQDVRAYGKVFKRENIDREDLRRIYKEHKEDVISHFESEFKRSNLLVIDVGNPRAFTNVMYFLGKTHRDIQFPRVTGSWYGPVNP